EGDIVIKDTVPLGTPVDNPKTHTAFAYATQLVILDEAGRVERMIAAHDVGRAINPVLCSGQIEGSLHMALGYAVSEELVCGADEPDDGDRSPTSGFDPRSRFAALSRAPGRQIRSDLPGHRIRCRLPGVDHRFGAT